MEPASALGLWRSDFGPVKIELDASTASGKLMGVWLYERNGQEVVGFFSGNLRGNVLDFTWHDPAEPRDLTGSGYVVFDPAGASFAGKLWTADGSSRTYDWNGWRVQAAPQSAERPTAQPPGPDAPDYQRGPDDPPADAQPEPKPRDPSVPGNPYGY